ncbi:MAG: hypothetical protein ACREGR_01145 [Minisyncoccia bacterium]
MKTFTQWAKANNLSLPVLEDTKRGGIASWAYPDAYVRSQYPDLYFTPSAADAPFKMKGHQPSRKGGGGKQATDS